MGKISIIVPIYNVEKYLTQCIESILAQTFEDFELLLIDDGSTDSSLEVCLNYEKKDKRIKVFSKMNGGVSSTRNYGLSKSTGQYIAFVDPDDWIHPSMYERMIAKMVEENVEVVMCGYQSFGDNVSERIMKITDANKLLTGQSVVSELLNDIIGPKTLNSGDANTMGSVWRMIVKSDVIKKNNFKFEENIPLMEDVIFCTQLFTKVKSVYLMEECFYYYRILVNSAMRKYRKDFNALVKEVYNKIEQIIINNGFFVICEQRLKHRYYYLMFWAISNECNSNSPQTMLGSLKSIKTVCADKKFINIINNIDDRDYTLKKKIVFFLLKNKLALPIYLYFKLS